jgi:lipopolysaccharide export system permease protein
MGSGTAKYLTKSFARLFVTIFLPIVAIGSLILLIRIAKYTEIVPMDLGEIARLFGYFVPILFFYTLPIAFFAALAITMRRLSEDYETTALFSFGLSPTQLLARFLPLSLAVTLLLLLLSLGLIPLTKQLSKSFLAYKRMHAAISVKPSQYGQKFGDWMVYLQSRDKKGNLENIILYAPAMEGAEEMLFAKRGRFFNRQGVMGLRLYNGHVYRIAEQTIDSITFDEMTLYHANTGKPFTYQRLADYWRRARHDAKRRKDLMLFIGVSLFPLLTLSYALLIGIHHTRYQSGWLYPSLLGVTLVYYGALTVAAKQSVTGAALFMLLFGFTGAALFWRYTHQRF